MTANKHTPGSWIVHKGSRWSHVKAANGDYIMEASRRSVARHHADAHLIAAAPELLEALEYITECYASALSSLGQTDDEAISEARAAIAKATGGAA